MSKRQAQHMASGWSKKKKTSSLSSQWTSGVFGGEFEDERSNTEILWDALELEEDGSEEKFDTELGLLEDMLNRALTIADWKEFVGVLEGLHKRIHGKEKEADKASLDTRLSMKMLEGKRKEE